MAKEEIFDKLKELVVDQLGVEEDEVTMEATMQDDLGADSLDLYSGFLVHTVDCFFRCTVADSSLAHAMDDAAELLWIPVKELRPEDFGLASVRKGIEKLLAQWP